MADHDQRFKVLLEAFFRDFLELFYPEIAACFDLSTVEWLQQEVFADPPQGERLALDLVAKLRATQALAVNEQSGATWMALIHVEVESKDSSAHLRPRVYAYYHELRERHGLPVLPIALLLRVGHDGIGWEVYEEKFLGRTLLHFEYPYVGLPALDGVQYLEGSNLLGVALAALMKLPEDRLATVKAQALDRVAHSGESAWRKFLLCECIDAYLPLEGPTLAEYQALLLTEPYREVRDMAQTTYERGQIEGQCRLLERLLRKRFGQLPEDARARLREFPEEELLKLGEALLTANSLQELGLSGESQQQ
jgi:hypothetical protein